MRTPAERIDILNPAPVSPGGRYVLYWMSAARRTTWNWGLQRALEHANDLGRPLVVLEALRAGYRWASDRFHRFVIDGMKDNRDRFREAGITYLPWVEPEIDAGKGLIAALAEDACVVVADSFPCFFLPRAIEAAARQVSVRFETVDSNGLLPLSVTEGEFKTAYSFRRFVQKTVRPWLELVPDADPLAKDTGPRKRVQLPEIRERWPMADLDRIDLASLPIDHDVAPAPETGGPVAAAARLERFLTILPDYGERRNHPSEEATSLLSPYLHFGHVSSHQVVSELLGQEGWTPDRLADKATGSRSGWWGVSESAEGFLDQIVTWRELGYVFCHHRPDYDRFDSLPEWAQETMAEHEGDERPHRYTPKKLEGSATHDPLWNAAQRQIVNEGRMHNYLRMLWGKKILEWSATPRKALSVMIDLNNKYGLDGRNPNSYSGIFWVLGRFDRAWGPERPIFGKIRYMTSQSTARKFDVKGYLARYGPNAEQAELPFA